MSESGCPRPSARCRRRATGLGDLDQPLGLALIWPDAHGERGVAVPALDDRAAVDRDDVALVEQPVRPGCRARSSSSATCRSPPGSRGSRGSSTGRRGGRAPRGRRGRARAVVTPGRMAARIALVHLGHDPARLAHDRQLVGGLAAAPPGRARTRRRSRGDRAARTPRRACRAVDLSSTAALVEPRDERHGLRRTGRAGG